ncbi:MAG: hypothetical protein H6835_07065 [Planctomycetes bacterium]|nr:hypothetical protein [Planctomycetota bacterium]
MQRLLILAAIPLCATLATAQCFEQNLGVLAPYAAGSPGLGDDVAFDVQPLNFAFPMGGLSTTYTHAQFGDNGNLYLTNGGASTTANMGAGNAYVDTATFLGLAGSDPRIMPLFADLMADAAYGGGVYVNNTIPGKFVVTWVNMVEWYATTIPGTPAVFTFQAQLFQNGDIVFYYDGRFTGVVDPTFNVRIGASEGNGVADPGSVDLSTPINTASSYCLYEEFLPATSSGLQNSGVTLYNASPGYVQDAGPCVPAKNEYYGSGCYTISDSFYERFADAALAAATLNGHSMTMQLAASDYVVTWDSGVAYIPPSGAASPVFTAGPTDDGETTLTPSLPFPTPTGPVASLFVESNGVISWGATGQTFPGTQDYTPTANGFLNGVNAGIYSWHDYAEQDVAGGRIVYEEVVSGADTLLVISWDNVDQWPTGTAQPNFMQFQLNLTSGDVTIVWQSLNSDTSSTFGSAHLVGYTPAGASIDSGNIGLSTTTTFVTSSTNVQAMKLTAGPAPISTPSSGTTVTYTAENLQQVGGGYIGLVVLSALQNPGLDLGLIGAPGCRGYVSTIDANIPFFGFTPTLTAGFTLPSGVPSGVEIYAQAINLIAPNSLPNGQNNFGMITSNGVKHTISSF